MKTSYRTLITICLLANLSAFSQSAKTFPSKVEKEIHENSKEESRSEGLKKITTSSFHNKNFDFQIDEEAIEANMESAIENAMKSVEFALERLETTLDPIEINLDRLDLNLDPIEINLPELNIALDPIDLEALNIDMDIDIDEDFFVPHYIQNRDEEDNETDEFIKKDQFNSSSHKSSTEEKHKQKDKQKSKAGKDEKDKTKGLKKIN